MEISIQSCQFSCHWVKQLAGGSGDIQGRVVQSWIKITQGSVRDLNSDFLKSISVVILFVYKLMKNYQRKCILNTTGPNLKSQLHTGKIHVNTLIFLVIKEFINKQS